MHMSHTAPLKRQQRTVVCTSKNGPMKQVLYFSCKRTIVVIVQVRHRIIKTMQNFRIRIKDVFIVFRGSLFEQCDRTSLRRRIVDNRKPAEALSFQRLVPR